MNRKYYIGLINLKKKELERLDYPEHKILGMQILAKYGRATQEEVSAVEMEYLDIIEKKRAIREEIARLETDLQEEIQKHDESLKEGNK